MLRNFEPRLYQQTIFATTVQYNTLVVLPTGLGKTNISLMLAVHRLTQYPQSKVLILAPTKPLVEQHVQTIKQNSTVPEEKIALFTGLIPPEQRAQQWTSAQVIVSTPQGLENDLLSRRLTLTDVSLLVFDEAHRAVGDYSYVWIAQQYHREAQYPKILALTASPGSDMDKIQEVITNLYIEEIEVRTEEDADVQSYVQPVEVQWVKVELPEAFKEVQQYFKQCLASKIADIKKYAEQLSIRMVSENKTELLALQAHLQGELAHGNKDFNLMKAVSVCAEAIKVQHALELLETQGITPLNNYLNQLQQQAQLGTVKAVKHLVQDSYFRMAFVKVQVLCEQKQEHPKLDKLKNVVGERICSREGYKLIVFTQYRDSGVKIVEELQTVVGVKAQLFVGQAKKGSTGLSQKKQVEMLTAFREGVFNVLVATSVGEEGLDIPQVDLVIFYEPIPSVIRHIQRRGRTGRHDKGEVIILLTKNTRDEGYRWSAHHKEKRMYTVLKDLRHRVKLTVPSSKEAPLQRFLPKDQPLIYVDYREKGNAVIKELIALGAHVTLETLSVGDYVVSPRCALEFKTQEDFVESLLDGRLLSQVKQLKESYERPLFIVEGSGDLYSVRNVHPNALRGLLATITVSYGIPILFTKNYKDTAELLCLIAKREQEVSGSDFSLHSSKKPMDSKELQEYIVSAFPGIGGALAKPLLKKFKTLKRFVNADEQELKDVDLIGAVKAQRIKELIEKEYE